MKKNNRNRKSVRRKKIKSTKNQSTQSVVFSPKSDFESEEVHQSFSMYGANYIYSDFENGLWKPLFDLSETLTIEEQQVRLVTMGYSEEEQTVTNDYLAPCAWVLLPSTEKKVIYDQLTAQFGSDFMVSEINPSVWELFSYLKTMIDTFSGVAQ